MSDDDQPPRFLSDYFETVSQFFDDSFVSEETLLGVKYAAKNTALPGCTVNFEPEVTLPPRSGAGADDGVLAQGKLGLSCNVDIPGLCTFLQTLDISTETVRSEVQITDLVPGATFGVSGNIGGEEESAEVEVKYVSREYYGGLKINRSTSEEVETNVALGLIWGNLTLGGELTRSSDTTKNEELLIGAGFNKGPDFTVGAGVSRQGNVWQTAKVAVAHKQGSVSAAATYELDLQSQETGKVCLGMKFPLDVFKESEPVLALKASTAGDFASTLSFHTGSGLSVQAGAIWNLAADGAGSMSSVSLSRWAIPKFGVSFSLEPSDEAKTE